MTLSATINEYTRSKIQNPILVYNESGDKMAVQYNLIEKNCTVWSKIMDHTIPTMFDTGATASFIDESHELVRQLPIMKLDYPRQLLMFDGRPSASGYIKYYLEVELQFHPDYPRTKTTLFVTRLSGADIVLGTSFLSDHGIALDFGQGTIRFPMVSASSTGKPAEDLRGSKMRQIRVGRPPVTGSNAIVVENPRYYFIPKVPTTIDDDNSRPTSYSSVLSTTDSSACEAITTSEDDSVPSIVPDDSDSESEFDVIIQDPTDNQDPRLSVTVSEEPEPGMQDDLDNRGRVPIMSKNTTFALGQIDDGISFELESNSRDSSGRDDSDHEYLYGPIAEGRKPSSIIQDYINGCVLRLAAVQGDERPMDSSGYRRISLSLQRIRRFSGLYPVSIMSLWKYSVRKRERTPYHHTDPMIIGLSSKMEQG